MQRFITFCALLCAFFVSACGGDGKKTLIPSTDYLGAEVGFRQKFVLTELKDGVSTTGYGAREVCFGYSSDPSTPPASGNAFFLYSNVSWKDGETPEPIGTDGFIELRAGNSYYNAGQWEKTGCSAGYENEWCYQPSYRTTLQDPDDLDMVAPVVAGQKLGGEEVWLRQEDITIAAGTYNAWYSEYSEDTVSDSVTYTSSSKRWFVPNIGIIKLTDQKVRKDTGVAISISDLEMTATSLQPLNQYGVSSGCATGEIPTD